MATRELIPGPDKGPCPCGCGLYGGFRTKVWRGEMVGHHRQCACPRCTGGRVKARARTRENKIAKDIGGARSYASGVISGYDIHTDEVEVEETSNKALVAGLKRWWLSQGVQSKMARLMSRSLRSRVFVASWDGKPQLAVMPYEDFKALMQMRAQKIL